MYLGDLYESDEHENLYRPRTIMICGTRNPISSADECNIASTIKDLHMKYNMCTLICEDRTSVDRIATRTASILGWSIISINTNWKQYGKNARKERNMHIIHQYDPNILIAFPSSDSKGTLNTVRDLDDYQIQYGSNLEDIIVKYLECPRRSNNNI